MISPARSKLNDMGMWLGAEATSYVKIALVVEDIEKLDHRGDERAEEWIKAFNLVHATMKRALERAKEPN